MITFSNQTTQYVKATNDEEVDACILNGWDIVGTVANAGDNPQFMFTKQEPVQETNYSSLFREIQ